MTRRRLQRSRTDRMICGVCAGLADYFDIDPVLARLGTVALTVIAPPVGVIAYIVCCLVIPEAPRAAATATPPPPSAQPPEAAAGDPGPPHGHSADAPGSGAGEGAGAGTPPPSAIADANPGLVGGLVLIGIGLLFLMINFDVFDWGYFRFVRWRYLWPAVMIGIGLWMIGRAALPDSPGRERRRDRERRRHAG